MKKTTYKYKIKDKSIKINNKSTLNMVKSIEGIVFVKTIQNCKTL